MNLKPLERPRLSEAEIDRRLLAAYRILGVLGTDDEQAEAKTATEQKESDQLGR